MSMPPPGPPNDPQGNPGDAVPPGYGPPPGYQAPPGGGYNPPGGQNPPGGYPPPGGAPPPGYQAPSTPAGYQAPGSFQPAGAPGGYNPAGGYGGYGATPGPLAEWPQRALGGVIDFIAPYFLALIVWLAISSVLGGLLWLAAIGWAIYNAYLNGQTGQSFGKQIVGLKVVGEQTGQVIGGGMGIVRWLAHIVDGAICYVGYLFPLWDAKKQTLADKIMKTVVITVPK